MKIYLAARYGRRAELQERADDLTGHQVTARWLLGLHEGLSKTVCASDDMEDLAAAGTLILFGESPSTGYYSGGQMVEFGLALAQGKRIIICGPRENVFTYLPQVEQYDTWTEVLEKL